jgi:hypothetical protein
MNVWFFNLVIDRYSGIAGTISTKAFAKREMNINADAVFVIA